MNRLVVFVKGVVDFLRRSFFPSDDDLLDQKKSLELEVKVLEARYKKKKAVDKLKKKRDLLRGGIRVESLFASDKDYVGSNIFDEPKKGSKKANKNMGYNIFDD